tara:strand:- start:64594 stop:65115 length:522 start_codon:yes stop_codon:yes gene_type:complete
MSSLIEGAGIFIYPLGLCSILALFIMVERALALKPARVLGDAPGSMRSKILSFYQKENPDPESLKAFTRLQVAQLERGLFVLEIIIGAAPLLGLLGTVTGLVQVFAHISPETGMPNPEAFIQGIALALTTTMIGLAIAIPALAGNSYLQRRIELLTAKAEVLIQGLIDQKVCN